MKSVAIAGFVIVAFFALASGAQDQAAPKEHAMTGCLKAGTEAKTFLLTDLAQGPKTVGIVSSTADLSPHVGHKVEITGTAVPNADAEKTAKDKAEHYMKVTAVKMVSATCP